MPANRFRIGFSGRALRGGNVGEFEPRVVCEQTYDALADEAGRTEHARAQLFVESRRLSAHARSLLAGAQRLLAAYAGCAPTGAGPMRVPRAWGLNVLRTQTVISVSSASGSTCGWSTLAP